MTLHRFCIIFAAFAVAGCQTMPPAPPPPPRVITVEVPTIVQRGCPDRRPPAEQYPDTDEKLALIPRGDFEQLGRVSRAARDLRDTRLAIDEVQIRGCAD
jgi:hypothetical protein